MSSDEFLGIALRIATATGAALMAALIVGILVGYGVPGLPATLITFLGFCILMIWSGVFAH